MQRPTVLIVLVIMALVVGGVGAQAEPLNVIATTTLIADVAQNVGGGLITVTALLPPNTDAHAYQPTLEDVQRIADADMLLVNGAGYETFLGGLIDNAGGDIEPVVVSNGIRVLRFNAPDEVVTTMDDADKYLGVLGTDVNCEAGEVSQEATEEAAAHGLCDPHIWMNPQNVVIWTNNIADAFASADPANADAYRANAAAYVEQLQALDTDIQQLVATVPAERRVLVTNHEFMGYFADAYGFEIAGTVLPGLSTGAEPSPQDLTTLVDLVNEKQVPAIFAEVSANTQLAEVVAQETNVNVVTTLYSESLSEAGGPADTYLNFMRYDAQTIADALAG
jgi:zinc/manganese transport system substrate-binding protein